MSMGVCRERSRKVLVPLPARPGQTSFEAGWTFHIQRGEGSMRSKLPLAIAAASVASVLALSMAAAPAPKPVVNKGVSPTLESIGPLAIGPAGILYAADPTGATIFALDLSKQRAGAPGTKDIAAIDQAIAS